MNSLLKVAIYTVVGGVGGYLTKLVIDTFFDELEQVEEIEEAKEAELEKVGVKKDEKIDNSNLIKCCYLQILKNPNWDLNCIDVDLALDSRHSVLLSQDRKMLNLYLKIPTESLDRKVLGSPKIGEYITSLNGLNEEIKSIMNIDSKIYSNLIGLVKLDYDIVDENQSTKTNQILTELPRDVYGNFRIDERRDGLTDFIIALKKGKVESESLNTERLADHINLAFPDLCNKEWTSIRLKTCDVYWKISIPMNQKQVGEEVDGLTLASLMNVLQYIYNHFQILSRGGEVRYENFIFTAKEPNLSRWDLLSCYEFDEKNKELLISDLRDVEVVSTVAV